MQATFGWIVAVAAMIKDEDTQREMGARIISRTVRIDCVDLEMAKNKAVLDFEDLNRAVIDPASIKVTYAQPALERRRTGNYV